MIRLLRRRSDPLVEELRRLPYRNPPAGLLDRLLADIPAASGAREDAVAPNGFLAFLTRAFAVAQRITPQLVASAAAVILVGSIAILFSASNAALRQGRARSFSLSISFMQPLADAIRSRAPSYKEETTRHDFPGAEARQWSAEQSAAAGPTAAPASPQPSDPFFALEKWTVMTEAQRRICIQERLDAFVRSCLLQWQFNPSQKRRLQEIGLSAQDALAEEAERLIGAPPTQDEFERNLAAKWQSAAVAPLHSLLREMRMERPGGLIERAVALYRARTGVSPVSLIELKDQIEPYAPGLMERLGSRPLTPEELAEPPQWAYPPWDYPPAGAASAESPQQLPAPFRERMFDYRAYQGMNPQDLYDGYFAWQFDRYFNSFLPTHPCTSEQRERMASLRNSAVAELKAQLPELVERQVAPEEFERAISGVWDRTIEEFYRILPGAK